MGQVLADTLQGAAAVGQGLGGLGAALQWLQAGVALGGERVDLVDVVHEADAGGLQGVDIEGGGHGGHGGGSGFWVTISGWHLL
ncbi:hypothetical protein D3C80_2095700 [compost metagenome]